MSIASRRIVLLACAIAALSVNLRAQASAPPVLSVSSATGAPGQSISVNINLALSPGQTSTPSSLQWTLSYAPNTLENIVFSSTASPFNKTPICTSGSGTSTCILSAANQFPILPGVIAVMQMTLSKTARGAIPVKVTNALGASASAFAVPIATSDGLITATGAVGQLPSLTSLSCASASVSAGTQTSCTVKISSALSSDTAISVLSSSGVIAVPIMVVIPAGSTSVTFTATAGVSATAQTVALTAVLNGTVQRFGLNVTPSNPVPVISSLSPGNAVAGGGDFVLAIAGSDFLPSSLVQWNNVSQPTVYINANLLKASIGAAAIAGPGVAQVTVSSPAPGGGLSGSIPFTISPPAPVISQVENGATFVPGPVAPGSFVAIAGINLADRELQTDQTPLPTAISNVSVTVNKLAAPLKGVTPNQVNAQLPWKLLPDGVTTGTADVVVTNSSGISAPFQIQLASAAPGLFYAFTDTRGVQRPAVVNGNDGTLPLPTDMTYGGYSSRPAAINDPGGIVLFTTGLGPVTNQPADGQPGLAAPPYSTTLQTPDVLIGGVPAQVVFSGLSPQFPGIYQVNAVIQPGTPTGDAVPIRLRLNGITTTDLLQIAVSN